MSVLRLRSSTLTGIALLVATLAVGATPVWGAAEGPTAIVERIDAPGSAIVPFDYLWPGDEVQLGEDNVLILGYLESCRRETIVGGQVKVGQDESEIVGATVHAERVPCDPIVATLTSAQADESGAVILRDQNEEEMKAKQSIMIFSASPVFSIPQPVAQIVVRRLDRDEPELVLKPSGVVLDTADSAAVFEAGGRYEARAGDSVRVFEIDPQSQPGEGPAVGRLISF